MIQIKNIIEEVKEEQRRAFIAWREADDKYDDPTYSEEYEDTLQRKFDEGKATGLLFVLNAFESIDLEKVQEEIATNGAQGVLSWLEEVYGEGLHATGAWQAYMSDDEEAEELTYYTTCENCEAKNGVVTVLEGVGIFDREANTLHLQPCEVCGEEVAVSGWLDDEEESN